MTSTIPYAQLDSVLLTDVVRRALRSPASAVVDWQPPVPLTDTAAVTIPSSGGVYRLRGTAMDEGRRVSWSVILKALHSPAGAMVPGGFVIPKELADDVTTFNYWKREALAYQTGLLDDLPGGLAAPRCLGVTEHPGERVWLWLEDLAAGDEPDWPLARHGLAARHLGGFNGAYLTGRPLPDAPWLSPGYLRSWTGIVISQIVGQLGSGDAWQHPLAREAFPAPVADRLGRLWSERDRFLDALARLPQGLAHLDAFRSNLFARRQPDGTEETVAIDWAFAGRAAIGEELGPLVVATVLYDGLPEARLRDLEATAFDAYVEGLREAGWRGATEDVRLGYCASVALRYAHLLSADVFRLVLDEGFRAATEARHGRPAAEIARGRATLVSFLLDRADEARCLLGIGG